MILSLPWIAGLNRDSTMRFAGGLSSGPNGTKTGQRKNVTARQYPARSKRNWLSRHSDYLLERLTTSARRIAAR